MNSLQPKIFEYNNNLFSEYAYQEHLKLYHGYVNKINFQLKESQLDSYSMNGIKLHELFFEQIVDSNKIQSKKIFYEVDSLIKQYLPNWKEDFKNIAINSRGWTALCFDELIGSMKVISLESHNNGLVYKIEPLLLLDMYEHSFFIDYGANKAEYIDRFFKNIDWDIINCRIREGA